MSAPEYRLGNDEAEPAGYRVTGLRDQRVRQDHILNRGRDRNSRQVNSERVMPGLAAVQMVECIHAAAPSAPKVAVAM
jgi:hypothetical protein